MLNDLSADGKALLFSETREGGGARSGVYLRKAESPVPVRLGDGVGDGLSPDGNWVLAHQDRKLVLIPTGTGQARDIAVEGVFAAGAAWLPDSRRAVVGGVIGKQGYRLHILDTLDETVKPISPENIWTGGTRAFAVSPDGLRVAGMNAEESIVIYRADGSESTPVRGVEKGEVPVQWSADGSALFVHDPTELPARVHRVNLIDGTRELWREFSPADPAGVYRIAPVFVTPDARAYAYNAMRSLSDLYVAEGLR
jgi:hypothetical protein